MARQRTKVINQTGFAVNLTMATGGIVSQESTTPVGDQESYLINIDPNATYREYVCVLQPGNENKVVLSSDDCAEYSEVKLYRKDDEGNYGWVGTKNREKVRAGTTNGSVGAAATPSATTASAPQQGQSSVGQSSNHDTNGAQNSTNGSPRGKSSRSRPGCCTMVSCFRQ